MTFLIFGLGSIGQRHVRLLRKALPNCRIAAVQQRRRQLIIHDDLSVSKGDVLAYYGIESVDPDRAGRIGADAGFVTNPISLHAETLRQLVEMGVPAFVEKPLSDRTEGLSELVDKADVSGGTVGYNLRWHPAVQHIQAILRRGDLGRLHFARFHFGEWLPGTRQYEDFRESHMARRDQGGGAILCLSHEVDLARFLLGEPGQVKSFSAKVSRLEIDVEDTLDATVVFANSDGSVFPAHITLNFLDRPPQRALSLHGEGGCVTWNYHENLVCFSRADGRIDRTEFRDFYRNLMFERQLENFLSTVAGVATPLCSLKDGLKTLDFCLRLAHQSHS